MDTFLTQCLTENKNLALQQYYNSRTKLLSTVKKLGSSTAILYIDSLLPQNLSILASFFLVHCLFYFISLAINIFPFYNTKA